VPAVVAVAFLVLFFLNWRGSLRSERLVTRIRTDYVPALDFAVRLTRSLTRFQRTLQDAVAALDTDHLREADAVREEMVRDLAAFRKNSALDAIALKAFEGEVQGYCELARSTSLAMIERKPGMDLTASLEHMMRSYNDLKARLDALSTRQKAEMNDAFASAEAAQRRYALLSGGITLVLLVGLSAVVARSQELAAKAYRESEERYRQLFDLNPQPMWVYDPESLRFLEVNEAAIEHYGYSREELLRMTLRDICPEKEIPRLLEDLASPPAARRTFRLRKHRTKDGRILDVEVTAHEISFYGRPARLVLLTDVTEKRKAEELLLKSQKLLQEAQRTAHIGSWDRDLATNEIVWSEELYRIFGRDPETFRPSTKAFLDRVHPEDRGVVETQIETTIRTGAPYDFVFRFVRPDGDVRILLASGSVILDQTGAAVRLFGTCQDVTEHRQLEEQLRQSQKMDAVGRLAGGIAHDFNNLLTVIQGYADVLKNESGVEEREQRIEAIEQIRIAGQRAAALTRQLLAFSRQQVLQPKVLDLNAVVSSFAPMLQRVIGEDITLVTNLDPRGETVLADAGQIEQVIMNLVVNSRDAMPRGGTLTVETGGGDVSEVPDVWPETPPGRYARLTVKDTGAGLSKEVQARVFEPFFTTKEVGKGTGLGLATVYGIVKQSGGFIQLHSEIGHGATFNVYLPCTESEVQRVKSVSNSTAAFPGEKVILLIEDERAVRKLLFSVLHGQGYTVLEAGSGQEALDISSARSGPIDLILSDVVMPGRSGPETVAELQRSRPAAQVIFMSGYTDDSVVRHGLTDSGRHFLQKPFTPVTLLKEVREVLEG
jgi:PAS domain S-box-containing protein